MMSTQEFFGIFLGFALAIATVFSTVAGYRFAIKRHFHDMRRYLELAGASSLMSWLVMTAVVFKYNKDYTDLMAAKMFKSEPETRIVGQGISQPKSYSVELSTGSVVQWSAGDGVRATTSGSSSGHRKHFERGAVQNSGRYILEFPGSEAADVSHGFSSVRGTESEDVFKL